MWSFIKWAVGVREEKNSMTHNSMGKLPENKFINNIYEYKTFERSLKQKNQQKMYSKYYDYFNHS